MLRFGSINGMGRAFECRLVRKKEQRDRLRISLVESNIYLLVIQPGYDPQIASNFFIPEKDCLVLRGKNITLSLNPSSLFFFDFRH